MAEWEKQIGAISLFVADLDRSRAFYESVFGLEVRIHDEVSVGFMFKDTFVFLTKAEVAPDLVGPVLVGSADSGVRCEFAIIVADVDAVCAELAGKGVTFTTGPADRAWGMRTATFADPDGHMWEIAQQLAG